MADSDLCSAQLPNKLRYVKKLISLDCNVCNKGLGERSEAGKGMAVYNCYNIIENMNLFQWRYTKL